MVGDIHILGTEPTREISLQLNRQEALFREDTVSIGYQELVGSDHLFRTQGIHLAVQSRLISLHT